MMFTDFSYAFAKGEVSEQQLYEDIEKKFQYSSLEYSDYEKHPMLKRKANKALCFRIIKK